MKNYQDLVRKLKTGLNELITMDPSITSSADQIIKSVLAKNISLTPVEKSQIYLKYAQTDMNQHLINNLPSLTNHTYKPPVYLTHPLLQVILSIQVPDPHIHYIREYVPLSDHGQVSIDWAYPKKLSSVDKKYYEVAPNSSTPIIILVHGLTGGSNKGYIKHLVHHFQLNGYLSGVFHSRGVNKTELSTPVPFDGGKLSDLRETFQAIRKKYPKNEIILCGTSLGANFLFRYLSEGNEIQSKCGIMLSPPFDLAKCTKKIEKTVYEKFFLSHYFNEFIKPYKSTWKSVEKEKGFSLEEVLESKTLKEFHTKFTCKLLKYSNFDEILDSFQITESHIKNMKIPCLVLTSRDDQICYIEQIPNNLTEVNKNIICAETTYGGHVSWFDGPIPSRWYHQPVLEFIHQFTETHNKQLMKVKYRQDINWISKANQTLAWPYYVTEIQ